MQVFHLYSLGLLGYCWIQPKNIYHKQRGDMNDLNSWLNAIGSILWHENVLYALLITGLILTVWSGFSQYRALTHGVKVIRGDYDKPDDPGAITHFQALSTALSATVGLGNIGGVALAISLGGPGAIFWMWVVGFLGMAVKITEVSLSMLHRDTSDPENPNGGPMWVMSNNLIGRSKIIRTLGMGIAGTFSVALIINTFIAGNYFQAWNVGELTEQYFGIPSIVTGVILAVIVGAVIIGGIKRIGEVTSKLVPFMLILYVLSCLLVLAFNFNQIPSMFALIFNAAFSPLEASNAFIGGAVGSAFMLGMQRALFSNEAGQGSSPVAHSAAKTKEPIREGVVAGLEPFVDTIVVCTMSALVILISGVWNRPAEIFINEAVFTPVTPVSENEWQLSTDDSFYAQLSADQNVFVVVSGDLNPQSGNTLSKVTGEVIYDNEKKAVTNIKWQKFTSEKKPQLLDKELYIDYVGAMLTAKAFDKAFERNWPDLELGKWLVTLASWLFAISTMISWSYYGEKGVVFLMGQKSVLPYRIIFCLIIVFATLGFIKTNEELNSLSVIGTGVCLVANLPIIWLFSHQAMREYKQYIRKLKAGDFL